MKTFTFFKSKVLKLKLFKFLWHTLNYKYFFVISSSIDLKLNMLFFQYVHLSLLVINKSFRLKFFTFKYANQKYTTIKSDLNVNRSKSNKLKVNSELENSFKRKNNSPGVIFSLSFGLHQSNLLHLALKKIRKIIINKTSK